MSSAPRSCLKALADNQQTMSALHEVAGGSAANTLAGLASLGATASIRQGVRRPAGRGIRQIHVGPGDHLHHPSDARRFHHRQLPDRGDAGQPAQHEHLSGRLRELAPDDVDEEQVASARILYIEGYLWDEEEAKQASRKAIAAVKGAGGKIALSLSDPFCVGRFRDEFLQLLDRM